MTEKETKTTIEVWNKCMDKQASTVPCNFDCGHCPINYEQRNMREQAPTPDYKAFAEWVAEEIFDGMWDYNEDSFAEIACRKLEKLGLVKSIGNEWVRVGQVK